jgi:hypothetical protein
VVMAGRNASMCVCFSCLNVTLGTSRYMARLRPALEPAGFLRSALSFTLSLAMNAKRVT